MATPYQDRVRRGAFINLLALLGMLLPFIALMQGCIAGTRAQMHMEYDALLNAFARPVLLLAFSALFWKLSPTLASLMWAQLVSYVLVTGFALRAFTRFYSLRALLTAI